MTRRRFYAQPDNFSPDNGLVTLANEEARHLREVLRLKAGDEVFVFNGEGHEYRCVIAESGLGKGPARLEICEEVKPARPESPLNLTLALALLKGEKFDLVVQKTTELGVSRITPVASARADVRLRDASDAGRRMTRWQRLALEACKQSGRAVVPAIDPPVQFSTLIQRNAIEGAETRLMFAERMGRGLSDITSKSNAQPQPLTALVGPEGGWDDEEISRAVNTGWTIITFGGRTLRAETAAVTVVALLQHLFGDLN